MTQINGKIAALLVAVSLALLIIYGMALAIAPTSVVDPKESGFLALSVSRKGYIFGGRAVIMPIIAVVISKNAFLAILVLLFVNGSLIIAGIWLY
jgi:hypothetical protein